MNEEIEEMAAQLQLEVLLCEGFAAELMADLAYDEIARSLYAKGWRLPK